MTKQKESDDIKQSETEPTDTGDIKKQKKSFLKKVIIFLFVVLLMGILVYIFTPFILSHLDSSPFLQEDEVISVEENLPQESVQETEDTTSEVMEPTAAPAPVEEPASDSQPTEVVEEATPAPVPPQETPQQNVKPEPIQTQIPQKRIPLLRVMQLYETFRSGKECRPLLEDLILLSKNDPEVEKNLMELLRICLENPMPQQIQEAFYDDKKRAILRILQNENPTWTAYVKMIPYTIFDIHRKNPTSDEPMDILYRIQNAVDANQFSRILELISQLPENVQPALYDLQQCASREATIYKNLQDLIQTLAQETNNE